MLTWSILLLGKPDFELIIDGLKMTLMISVLTAIVSLPLGIILGIMRTSKIRILRWPATLYIELIRSLPLVLYMVMIFLTMSIGAENRGVFTLASFTAAYIAEIVRGGLNSVDKNQIRAAYSLGMKTHQVLLKIAIPQALTRMIPALVNQFNVVIKDTSLVSIGLLELTKAGKILSERKAMFSMEIMLIIAAIYFVVCYGLSIFGHYLENKFSERYKRTV
ncbi:MAG: amino acid ABC transporter permease [Cyanobacteriota bacterium]